MKTYHLIVCILGIFLGTGGAQAAIRARGSDSTMHVIKSLAAAFEAETKIPVTVEGGGSSAGARALISGEVSLAFLSRKLKASELADGLVGHIYAIDGVAIIVHPDNPMTDVELPALRDILTGRTATWPDGRPVVLFNRNADSGTREVVQEIVLGKETFSPNAQVKHDGVLVSTVARIPTAMAYTSFGEIDKNQVKVLSIAGIAPSADTLRDGSYQIARTPCLATKGEAAGEEKAFIDFVLSPKGQAIVVREGLIAR
ncbi:phosphate ABC transporter substrate-binding protein [Termitidicoccus mucosus]|uniref:PBP domain-containing protein n=1 Tax=Termitidicoccus mucosus TaxID=1184151 RepID=A0A178IJR2_9BACT|nr:hypothetical protein AW736_10020 [Opitutaceae bacterium TSB47]